MPLPGNVTLVTLTGKYCDYQGSPIVGSIYITSSQTLRDMLADVIVVASTTSVTLDSNGEFTVILPGTNDPDLTPVFTYSVEEAFAGGRTFTMSLDVSDTSVDISDVAPTYVINPIYNSYVSLAPWLVLDAVVQDMDSKVNQTLGAFIPISGPLIYPADITAYAVLAEAQQSAAEASLADAELSLADIVAESSLRLHDFSIIGA